MTSPPNPRFVLTRLQREWKLLSTRPSAVRRAASWRLTPNVVSSLDDVLTLTGQGPGPAGPSSDETLRRLVVLARHDDLAARIVLQRMLPGLSACARRNSTDFGTRLDALDDLLSTAWTVIRSFPIDRRDRYVIKNLLRDCEYRTFLKARRRKAVHESVDPSLLDIAVEGDDHDAEPLVSLLDLLATARAAGMSDLDLAMVAALLNTSTVKQAATLLRVTDRTIRNRRQAVVRQLKEMADVA